MEKNKLLILGAGSYAEEIAEIVSLLPGWQLEGFVEGFDKNRCKDKIFGNNIYWIDEIAQFRDFCTAICAVGSTKRYKFIAQAEQQGLRFSNLISPGAFVPPSVFIGTGVIIGPGTIIGSGCKLNDHSILTRGCMIGHHVEIGCFSTLGAGVNVGGRSKIFDRCFIGLGANIIDHTTINAGSFVGAGSLVTSDVPSGVMVFGVPAQIVKNIESE